MLPMRRLVLLPSLLLGVTCGSGDGGENDITDPADLADSRFTATVAGLLNQSFQGGVNFGSANGATVLTMNGGGFLLSMTRLQGSRPGTGSHPIVEPGVQGDGFSVIGVAAGMPYFSASGTLNLTTSTTQRLEGTMQFQAADSLGDPAFTVNASFKALCATGGGVCN